MHIAHHIYMRAALALAAEALTAGELPIAALLVRDGQVIAQSTTAERREGRRLVHAELLTLDAADRLHPTGDERARSILYTTLEPCPMCLGAAMSFGVGVVCYALASPTDGAVALMRSWRRDEADMPGYALPDLLGPESLGEALAAAGRDLFQRYAADAPPGPLRDWALTVC